MLVYTDMNKTYILIISNRSEYYTSSQITINLSDAVYNTQLFPGPVSVMDTPLAEVAISFPILSVFYQIMSKSFSSNTR